MSTSAELMADLRAADAAGDEDLAAVIALKIKELESVEEARAELPPARNNNFMGRYNPVINLMGMTEAGGSLMTGLAGTVAGGVAGAASLPFVGPQRAADIVQDVQGSMFMAPPSQVGNEYLQMAGDIGEFIDQPAQWLGDQTLNLTGSPGAATAAYMTPDLILSALGIGGTKHAGKPAKQIPQYSPAYYADLLPEAAYSSRMPAITAAKRVGDTVSEGVEFIGDLPVHTPGRKQTAGLYDEARAEGRSDGRTAGFDIKDGRATRSASQQEALKQGWNPGLVANIRDASPATRAKLRTMVDEREKGFNDPRYEMDNPASDVVGDSIADRYNVVLRVNRDAGKRIDAEAKKLKREQVDFAPAMQRFEDALDEMRVRRTMEDGEIKVDFNGSSIEGATGAENLIMKILKRGFNVDEPMSALTLHEMKRFIDEQVSYGKLAEGLTGKAESAVKTLRHDIDALLDSKFDSYRVANEDYAETISLINEFQKNVGQSVDLTARDAAKQIGLSSRKIMSHQQRAAAMAENIDRLDELTRKHNVHFDDDVKQQALFVRMMDDMFGSQRKTSLQGDAGTAVSEGLYDISMLLMEGSGRQAPGIMRKGYNWSRGINSENQFKAMRELIEEYGYAPFARPGESKELDLYNPY